MIDKVSNSDCVLCGACLQKCPQKCISFSNEYCSFEYPVIDFKKCVNCDMCETVCPAINELIQVEPIETYALKNKDNDIVEISSSGGFFYMLANYVIENGGIVCGAAFDENFIVKHRIIDSKKDIPLLCGSKYVQSDLNNCFNEILLQLKKGTKVLFSGCPCQTAALKMFVGKDYENLFLVDFICHASVSAIVFEEYKNYLEKKYKGKIINYSFRNKDNGWLLSGPKVVFSNGAIYSSPMFRDVYMQGYFNNLNVKESCFSCKYKNFYSGSDITMADFWGIDRLIPDFYDYMGSSAIVVNTKNGKKLFEKVSHLANYIPVDIELITEDNKGLIEPFKKNPNRLQYFKEAKSKGYIKPLEKYIKVPLKTKIKNKLKRILLAYKNS